MSFSRTLAASVTGFLLTLAGVGAAAGAAQATAQPATVHPAAVSPAVVSHGFTAVGQTRLLDTRTDPAIHKLGPAGTADVTVTGIAGVPSTGVSAVVLNVTAIARTASTYLTVYPAGAGKPNSSNLNVLSGFIRANQVIAQVGTNGQITIYNYNGNTDVLVDITGYLADTSTYTGQTPARILDTRVTKTPLAAHATRAVQVTGHGGVPTGVTSVVVNMTGLSTSQGGYLTAYPTLTTRPVTSNLNLTTNQTSAVLVIAKLSSSGSLTLYSNGGPTNVLLDVQGWFTGTADYASLNPVRILDSRVTTSAAPYGTDYEMQVSGKGGVPAGAGAVALSVTSVDPSSTGTVTVHPGGTKIPGTSSINAPSGRATPNLVIVQLSSTGTISIYNHAPGPILVDVEGWFATNPALTPPNAGVVPGVVGQSYDFAIAAPGGLAPLTWSVISGALPAGLTLDTSNGALTGTPTTAGPSTVKIGIADSSNETAQQSFTFTVYSVASKQVWGWGSTGSGVLGSTATGNASTSAIPVSGISGYTQVADGGSTAYGLKADGTVEAWGKGTNGQLGDGSTTASTTTPVPVTGLTNVIQVASGGAGGTGYALEGDGTVWAWGKGQSGQLGDGTTTAVATTPVQVHNLTSVTAIGTGPTTTYAVQAGKVYAWGSGGGGQIGNGLKVSETSPVPVSNLTGVTAVAGAYQVGYALKGDGTVWAWGTGTAGQLGNGTLSTVTTPGQVHNLTDITQIAAGYGDAYALHSGGTVSSWGAGPGGALGSGGLSNASLPVTVSGLSNVTQVAGGNGEGYALDTNGKVWSWGLNTASSLGLGSFGHPTTFVQATPARVLAPALTSIAANHSGNTVLGIGPN
jgi:alpha-tubulin suppressor-like RCC1 family protein